MFDKFRKFMYGRYGVDEYGKSMLTCALVLSVLGLLLNLFFSIGGFICSVLSYVLIFRIIFRALSKNINKRVLENHKFLGRTGKIRDKIKFLRTRFNDRKNYKYVKCPYCKNYNRLPRGKGKIKFTCRVCKKQMEKKV